MPFRLPNYCSVRSLSGVRCIRCRGACVKRPDTKRPAFDTNAATKKRLRDFLSEAAFTNRARVIVVPAVVILFLPFSFRVVAALGCVRLQGVHPLFVVARQRRVLHLLVAARQADREPLAPFRARAVHPEARHQAVARLVYTCWVDSRASSAPAARHR